MRAEILVHHCVFRERTKEKQVSQCGENQRSADRVQKLTSIVAHRWRPGLYLFERPVVFLYDIEDQKSNGRENYVPEKNNQQHGNELVVAKGDDFSHGVNFVKKCKS